MEMPHNASLLSTSLSEPAKGSTKVQVNMKTTVLVKTMAFNFDGDWGVRGTAISVLEKIEAR